MNTLFDRPVVRALSAVVLVVSMLGSWSGPVPLTIGDRCCLAPFVFPANPEMCRVDCVSDACSDGTLWEIAVKATCLPQDNSDCVVVPAMVPLTIIEVACRQFPCISDPSLHSCIWMWTGGEKVELVDGCAPNSTLCPPVQPVF